MSSHAHCRRSRKETIHAALDTVRLSIRARHGVFAYIGVVLVPIALLFTARVVCEQTILPWKRGASPLGFSFIRSYADIAGILVVLGAVVWALDLVIRKTTHRLRLSWSEWALIAILLVCCGAWVMPYERWLLLTVRAHDGEPVPRSWVVSAAATGQLRLLRYLLSSGVDVDTRGRYGESPLGAAAAAGQIEAARLLLARGAPLESRTDISRETPLIEAALADRADMVELLMERGADPGARDAMNRTAQDWAQYHHNTGMAGALRTHRE